MTSKIPRALEHMLWMCVICPSWSTQTCFARIGWQVGAQPEDDDYAAEPQAD